MVSDVGGGTVLNLYISPDDALNFTKFHEYISMGFRVIEQT